MRSAVRPAGSTTHPITGWVPGTRLTAGGADAKIPDDHRYYITTFGGGADTQNVACGGPIADGSWYYLADKDRFRCGTHVRITDPASGRSVVAKVADVGPARWVERNAGGPIIDASPLVLRYLFGRMYGWSDRVVVIAESVDPSTPLGPSSGQGPGPSVLTAVTLIAMAAGAWWWLGRR